MQHDRARTVYKYALDKLPEEKREDILKAYTIHEKKFGDRTGIESIISNKRKLKYEEVSLLSKSLLAKCDFDNYKCGV